MPVLKQRGRGNRGRALEVASDPEAMNEARNKLREEMLAPTTAINKDAKLDLAEKLAVASGHSEIYPLTYSTVEDVAAALKAADFSSGAAYLKELRARHEDLGHKVEPWLHRLFARCQASIERGLGGQTKARTFKLALLAEARKKDDYQGLRGAIIAVWWVLRGIVLNNVSVHDKHITTSKDNATLCLPVSKTDTQGTGARRSWACLCGARLGHEELVVDKWARPPCTLGLQLKAAWERHGVKQDQEDALDKPLCSRSDGDGVTKAEFIATWRRADASNARNPWGREHVTGRSARRMGVQILARAD